jgi:hypothetical protein
MEANYPMKPIDVHGQKTATPEPARTALGKRVPNSWNRLFEDPQDAVCVRIDEDAAAVYGGGAHSAGPRQDGHILRHDLAGRDGSREAGSRSC